MFGHSVWHDFWRQKLTVISHELRAHLALAGDFGDASTALSETIILSTPPTPRKVR
jgi:hypothetical protein